MNSIINKLKTAYTSEYDGQLYVSMPEGSLACGSPVYDQCLVQSITVEQIRESGVVVLFAHFPSKYTGRWERSTIWCKDVADALTIAVNNLGKPASALP
jgi:hypothetical protein